MTKKRNYRSTADASNTNPNQETSPASSMDGVRFVKFEEAIEKVGFGTFQLRLSLAFGLLWMIDSMEFMVPSILGPELLCQWRLSSTQEAFISFVTYFGIFIGAPAFGHIGDMYGRRKSLLLGQCWSLYFALLSSWSPTFNWLLTLRFLYGFGIGSVFQIPTYFIEFLPPSNRGKCIILLSVWWAIGGLLEVILAMSVLLKADWRWWLVASASPLALLLPAVYILPNTPHYDMASGRLDSAMATLQQMAKANKVSLPVGKLLQADQKPHGKFRDMFGTREQSRITILTCIIWGMVGFLYSGLILMSPGIISSSGCNSDMSNNKAACSLDCQTLDMADYRDLLWTSVAELPATLLTALIIDIIGRKRTMLLDFILTTVVFCLLSICPARILRIVLLFIGRGLTISVFMVNLVYTQEASSTKVRALTVGTAAAVSKIAAAASPFVGQHLWQQSPQEALWVFAGLALIGAIATALLPYDTTNRSLSTQKTTET